MPRRIVLTSWGSFGDVYPYVGLAHALAKRGHHPVLAVPAYYRPLVEREGYTAPRVARELKRVLTNHRYAQRAAEVARVVGAEGGADAATVALEQGPA